MNISSIFSAWLGKVVVGFSHGKRSKLYDYRIKYNDNQHVVKTYLNLLDPFFKDIVAPKNLIRLEYTKKDLDKVESFLEVNNIKDRIMGICATAAESAHSRVWPKEKFAILCNKILDKHDLQIVFVGAPRDKEYNQRIIDMIKNNNKAINSAGKTTVKQSFALIEKCSMLLSNDTGPMHIGAAQRTPTIGLFCPNTPVRFGPYGKENISIYNPVLKKPCINVHLGKIPNCENHNHMSNISVEEVFEAVEKLLESALKQ